MVCGDDEEGCIQMEDGCGRACCPGERNGSFTVYDLRVTAPGDFVANGTLALDKPHK